MMTAETLTENSGALAWPVFMNVNNTTKQDTADRLPTIVLE